MHYESPMPASRVVPAWPHEVAVTTGPTGENGTRWIERAPIPRYGRSQLQTEPSGLLAAPPPTGLITTQGSFKRSATSTTGRLAYQRCDDVLYAAEWMSARVCTA